MSTSHQRNRLPLLLLFAFFVLPLVAQTQAVIQGRVADTAGHPLELVNVGVAADRPIGTTTDKRGHYRLEVPADVPLPLMASYIGMATYRHEVLLRQGETRVVDITLRPASEQLPVIEVGSHSVSNPQFTPLEPQQLAGVVGPTAGVEALLKSLPDVASRNELSSQYSVRGGSFDENLVYINGVEVFRPQLVHSGQQEGQSIINPDLVDHLQFSPGGFEAAYGDKLSSVLDITYGPPRRQQTTVSASLTGATAAHAGSAAGGRLTYALGARLHSNNYLLGSLDTKGAYTSRYTDLQALVNYRLNEQTDLQAIALFSHNTYRLVPESQTTMYGGFFNPMKFEAYFDGQELDRYTTLLGAVSLRYRPSDEAQFRWTTAVQHLNEQEIYDIQTQYWIYQVSLGASDSDSGQFERGVGTYLDHARNYLSTTVAATEFHGRHFARLGQWQWGVKVSGEHVADRMRQWRWVDSAGYTLPSLPVGALGDSANSPQPPLLQLYSNANSRLTNLRLGAYAQRGLNFFSPRGDEWSLLVGLRAQLYGVLADSATLTHADATPLHALGALTVVERHLIVSPRLSLSFHPQRQRDVEWRFATGVYSQPPLYREYRRDDGTLNLTLTPQRSYQVMATYDRSLRWLERPFRFTADLYYKYITDLIPYRVDNLRVYYDATNDAVAYAAGLSLRMAGEFVPGLESWVSLSLMQTQEDLLGDTLGWLARPTDQRFAVKVFFQDYIPRLPAWKMSLGFTFASGLPVDYPNQQSRAVTHRLPAYFRVDFGNAIDLCRLPHPGRFVSRFDRMLLGVDILNLFDYRNVASYLWVVDYDNVAYHVPNYLTSRRINLKVTLAF